MSLTFKFWDDLDNHVNIMICKHTLRNPMGIPEKVIYLGRPGFEAIESIFYTMRHRFFSEQELKDALAS